MAGPKRRGKPKVQMYSDSADIGTSQARVPTSTPIAHISYHSQHNSISVSRQFIQRSRENLFDSEPDPAEEMEVGNLDCSAILTPADNPDQAALGATSTTSESWKRKVYASDRPLLAWIPQCSMFLDELIRHEGRRGSLNGMCIGCQKHSGVYCCDDCFTVELHCLECILALHVGSPFHHIKQWDGAFFRRISLKSLGLHIQLGHTTKQSCIRPLPVSADDDFLIIDNNGIHEVGLDFCGCEGAQSRTKQLLRARLYPATIRDPRSAATFRVLQQFHLLSFESKTSAYEFYSALARLTDNTGTQKPRDRYEKFMRMICEWRNLKLLKRTVTCTKPITC